MHRGAVAPASRTTAPHDDRSWPVQVAWGVAALGLALAAGTVAMAVANGVSLEQAAVEESLPMLCLLAVSYTCVGALLLRHRPANPVGWVLAAAGLLQGLVVFCEQYAVLVLLTHPGTAPGGELAAWLKEWLWAPGLALIIVLLPLIYPTGRPPATRWWAVAWLGGVAVLAVFVAGGLSLWPHRGEELLAAGGEAEYDLVPTWTAFVDRVAFPALVLASALALVSLVGRFRVAEDRVRRQVLWFGVAVAVALAFSVVSQMLSTTGVSGVAAALLGPAAAVTVPVATGVAVLRHRLYDLDVVLDRTLLWGGLAGAVVAFYVLVVGILGELLRAEGSVGLSLAATGVVAVLFAPVRERLQRVVDRVVYGERPDPYDVLLQLSRHVEAARTPQTVLSAITDTVWSALKPGFVAVEVGAGSERRLVARAGDPNGEPIVLPLVHGGSEVGRLLVGPRSPRQPFSTADSRLLADIGSHAAVAVQTVRLAEDLQRSRERLVVAREEERRRLRRDLHDGVGPALSSSLFKLAAARRRLSPGSAVDRALVEVRDDLRETVAGIRTLAYDLRPPTLDQLGLLGAVEEYASRLRESGLAVELLSPAGLPPLSAAVEVAAYHIVREGMSNVVRHAGARQVEVAFVVEDMSSRSGLVVRVRDDGRGVPSGRRGGVGMSSMRERAEELGGTLSIESTASGTTVSATLPLEV